MERLPGESNNQYHTRLVQANRAQQQIDLTAARAEAERTGKQPFDDETFRRAYHKVRPYLPTLEEMEIEYYLDYPRTRNLDEFMQALFQTDLYDGSDMRLDP
jgi:hypothetical protein